MVAKNLSTWHKVHFGPDMLERDGPDCFYCNEPFLPRIIQKIDKQKSRVFDHLNNNENDNRIENLCFAHWICNEQKKYKNEWIAKAKKKLKENERSSNVEVISHANTDKDTGTEIDTNAIYYEVAEKYLKDNLNLQGNNPPQTSQLDNKTTLDIIAARVRKRLGHSSQNTARRIIDVLTAGEDGWLKIKDKESHRWVIILDPDQKFQ